MLPLVEEVREARRLADESQLASLQLNRISAALVAISLLTEKPSSLDSEIPGRDIVEELAEEWPALSDLEAIGPRASQDFRAQLFSRQTQLRSAEALLRSVADDLSRRSGELHELQHRQRHLLEDPRYARDVAELGAIGAERGQVDQSLQPLKHRQVLLVPALEVATHLTSQLSERLANCDGTALTMQLPFFANGVLDGLRLMMTHLKLATPLPENLPTDLTDYPDGDPLPATRDLMTELEALRTSLLTVTGEVNDRVHALEERHAELTAVLLERMG